eukprot:TRINITY_DN2158_c0_g2_i14.p1 TRINITY_DN2158_c0_g2~~TRINITY_DN2158_c0_g2_i14.p1  ORF type:complete len:481 (+),score=115.15 TRINITY_DN2158_c0_g2_i14:338-1780(+)
MMLLSNREFTPELNMTITPDISFAFKLSPIKFGEVSLLYEDTTITAEKDYIMLDIKDATVEFEVTPEIDMEPKFFFGKGSYKVDIAKVNLATKFGLQNVNNRLRFEMKSITPKIDVKHFNLIVLQNATNDLIGLVFLGADFMLRQVATLFTENKPDLPKNITALVNSMLELVPSDIFLPGTDMSVFIDLMDRIEIEKDYFFVGSNFSAECRGQCLPYDKYKPQRPAVLRKHSDYPGFQCFLSDFTVNTLAISAYQSSLLNNIPFSDFVRFVFPDIDFMKLLAIFFPEIKKYASQKLDINAAFNDPPIIEFKEKETNFKAAPETSFTFIDKENKPHVLFNLAAAVTFNGWVNLTNSKLTGHIEEFNCTFKVTSKELKTTAELIQGSFNVLRNILVPQINSLLQDGIELPPVPFINLSAWIIALEGRYLRIAIDSPKLDEEAKEIFEWALKKLSSLLKRRRVQQTLAAKIPKNLPKWIKLPI